MTSIYEHNKRNRDGERDLMRHLLKTAINDAIYNYNKKYRNINKRKAIEWINGKNKDVVFTFQKVIETIFQDDVDVELFKNRILYLIENNKDNLLKK